MWATASTTSTKVVTSCATGMNVNISATENMYVGASDYMRG